MPLVPTLAPVTTDTVVNALISRLSSAINPLTPAPGTPSPFWTPAELQSYAVESCRTWNALAAWCKSRLTFNTLPVPNAFSQWYDLSEELPLELGYNLTDYALATVVEWHLLEPPTYPAWTGTPMFSTDDILEAVGRRRDQFILESLQVLSFVRLLNRTPSPGTNGRTAISDSILDIRRIMWQDATSLQWNVLWRSNEFSAASYLPRWDNTPGPPQAYSIAITPGFQIQLIPAPGNSGNLHMVVAAAGPQPSAASYPPGVSLGVPDDWVWVVKWGVLADLLSMDGPARDPERAKYCESRWRQGLQFARLATTVLNVQLASGTVPVGSVFGLDSYRPSWVNAPAGPPSTAAVLGFNIMALDAPSATTYGVSFDAVTNSGGINPTTGLWTPFPTDPNAYVAAALPVGRDALDVIVDYSEHLAAFKMGGEEFMATAGYWDRMVRLAQIYNERMKAVAEPALFDRVRLQESEVPVRVGA